MFAFTRLNVDHIALRPDQVLLRSTDYQQYLDAEALVAQARNKAHTLHQEAQVEYERQAQLGREEGMRQARAAQAELIHETLLERQRFFDQVASQMCAVVLQAMRKLIRDYPASDLVLEATREGLSLLGEASRITLRVHPQEMSVVRERVEQLVKQRDRLIHIDVVADAHADRGGCVLESEIGNVDASIETQLGALQAAIEQGLAAQ